MGRSIQDQLTALGQRLDRVEGQPQSAPASEVDALRSDLDKLRAQAPVAAPAPSVDVEAIKASVIASLSGQFVTAAQFEAVVGVKPE